MRRIWLAACVLLVVGGLSGSSIAQRNPRAKKVRVPATTIVEPQTTEAPSVTINRLADTLDFNNDGKTDYSIFRARSVSGNSNFEWYIRLNGTTTQQFFVWGLARDIPVPADYDGDGKTDIATWRPDPTPVFYIIQSSDGTFRNFAFGKPTDDPLVTSDFDGDGKVDPGIFRQGQQGEFWYQSSRYGGPVMVPWGTWGDTPVSGDFNGDGWNDFRIMRDDGNGNAVWYTRFSVPIGTALPADKREYFGLVTDDFVPGDFDGDRISDLCITRPEGPNANWVWYIKSSQTGLTSRTAWGLVNQDLETPGDYDGDGKTDIAVWRYGNDGGGPAYFLILNSSNGTSSTVQFGLQSPQDYALGWWNVQIQAADLSP